MYRGRNGMVYCGDCMVLCPSLSRQCEACAMTQLGLEIDRTLSPVVREERMVGVGDG